MAALGTHLSIQVYWYKTLREYYFGYFTEDKLLHLISELFWTTLEITIFLL